jgi:tRNA-uridine 2-sulfurtransferase
MSPASTPPKGNACYGPDEAGDIEETAALCRRLAIPYRVIDCSEQYEKIVLDYFRGEYRSGRTPNPCVRCNHEVKFGVLPRLAREAGVHFDMFATGHYARTEFDGARRRHVLKKGADAAKDQSYFLYRLSQEQLASTLFPVGALHKEEVRRIARDAGLAVHDKEESQDFYSGSYGDIIGGDSAPGDIVDAAGKIIGRHNGIWNYTIGQRKGLGIAWSEPLYVVRIDAQNNRIVAGTAQETMRSEFTVADCTWGGTDAPDAPFTASVKIRSASPEAEARVEPLSGGRARVRFSAPRSAITPGQSAVFYDGESVLGGGIIDTVES